MPYVYSTLTCSNIFPVYARKSDPRTLSTIIRKIEILGGHGLKNPKGIDTPQGVVTKVTDEELEILENDISFKMQVDKGFITVDKKKVDPAKKAADMNPKDGSAPLTPKDFEVSDQSSPETPIYKNKNKQASL